MLDAGADATNPPDGFKDDDLRALRRETGDGFGEGLPDVAFAR